MTLDAVSEVIANELESLNSNEEYVKAQNVIFDTEQALLDRIAGQLKEPLKAFIPDLRNVEIKMGDNLINRHYLRRRYNYDVFLDDGIMTNLAYKGDGIKSLVALAVLQDKTDRPGASIVAIEEPESHLHSGAIHDLVNVIDRISARNQVIITTHNPLFVQQNRISQNIIVDNGKARPARNIEEIRETLGVLASDNLRNANNAVIVEGETDKIILAKILSSKSSIIKSALSNNRLIIYPLRGASSLSYELQQMKNEMCRFVVLLDNDQAGKSAVQTALNKSLLKNNEYGLTSCPDQFESEIEDCIRPAIYRDQINSGYAIDVTAKKVKSKDKWSKRMETLFNYFGVEWNDATESDIKQIVANAVSNYEGNIEDVIIEQKSAFIERVIPMIETMLEASSQ